MRSKLSSNVLRGMLAAPLVVAVGASTASADPAEHQHHDTAAEYVVTELGTLDGAGGAGISINNRGWVAGHSNEDGNMHATLWRDGSSTDLGTLGGPNSAVLWPVKNDSGMVVGVSETPDIDPRDEAWSCSAFFGVNTEHACVGFVWEDGEMRALPTHGGTHGFAAGANNRGQVVGWAETAEEDETCNAPQELGFRAALWDTSRPGDPIRELPPLPGDTASSATAINDLGQVAGISGICSNAVGGLSAEHAVIWQGGKATEIGDLGGEGWNTPMAINNFGVVVGFANQEGAEADAPLFEAFRWTRWGGVDGLGMLDGDRTSQALGVNTWGRIVGMSSGDTNRAFIWRNGEMTDLNTLVGDYGGHLLYANDINEWGVITGAAVSAETGETVAFVARPAGWRH